MNIREWLSESKMSVLELAQKLDASIHAVKKWTKFDQKDGRIPRPAMQAKIRTLSGGLVQPNDWVK